MQGVKYEASVSIDSLLDRDSTATAAVTGKLPKGLELDTLTGGISGTPTEAGNFEFSISYLIDGYITKTAKYSIKIDSALALDADGDKVGEMKVGEEFMNRIVSAEFTSDKYDTIKYAVKDGKLPAGVQLSEDGTIKGTPTEAGTYTAVIEMTATKSGGGGGSKDNKGGNKGGSTTETTKLDYEITFVVAGDGQTPEWTENVPYIGENGNWFVNGVDTGKTAQGPAGKDGTDGTNGTDGKGGCSSSIAGAAGIVGMTCVCAAVSVICLIKKRKEN